MRNIYLVRHGKIKQEAGGRRCIGQTDLPLDEKYVSSILKLGNWFAERQHHQKASVVLASGTLKRACDTAKYLKEGAGEIISGNILFDENLNEVYTGLWENREFEEIKVKDQKRFEERGKSLGYFRFPEGESIYEAGVRLEKGLNKLRRENSEDLIMVSHSGAIRAFLCKLLGLSADEHRKLGAANISSAMLLDDGEHLFVQRCGYKPTCLLGELELKELYQEYNVPEPVIAHMQKTAEFTETLKPCLKESDLDWERIRKAALVHDILRTERLHVLKGADALRKEGYYEIAELVEKHHDPEFAETSLLTEAEILFYADSRVKENEIVSVEERYQASYGKCHCAEAYKKHKVLYEKAKSIEKKIFG